MPRPLLMGHRDDFCQGRCSALGPLALGLAVLAGCGEDSTRMLNETSGGAEQPAQNPDAQNPDAQNPDAQNPDAQNPDAQNPDAQNPDTQDPETPAAAPTVYAVMSTVAGPEGDSSYLVTIDSIDAGSELNLDQGIEFPGTKSILGVSGLPSVWVTSWEEPIIERWDLNANGSFEPGPTISFAALGVSNTGFVSQTFAFTPERAAFYSSEIGELIQWNPTTMQIIATLPLDIPDTEAPGGGIVPPSDGWVQLRDDGTVVVNYYYLDGNTYVLGDRVGMKVVDWVQNEIIGSDEWIGCNYLGRGSRTSDGTIYYTALAQWVQDSLIWPGEPTTAVPCALRVLPGATTFDRDFDTDTLGVLTGGMAVTGSLEILNDSRSYFVAWDNSLVTEPLTAENFDVTRYSTPAWRWYTWDLQSDTASVVDAEPFASQPDVLWAGGRALFRDQRFTAERGGRGMTPMYELTADGRLVTAFTGYGIVDSIVKVSGE